MAELVQLQVAVRMAHGRHKGGAMQVEPQVARLAVLTQRQQRIRLRGIEEHDEVIRAGGYGVAKGGIRL
jgi:D-serine deaminase-like pyridoxal phosphate-dependent protein|eukprot:jgi/Chrpa1/7464/Chrysochromulina_OHIO_Genome00000297-RA